jgi:hypothetical protein
MEPHISNLSQLLLLSFVIAIVIDFLFFPKNGLWDKALDKALYSGKVLYFIFASCGVGTFVMFFPFIPFYIYVYGKTISKELLYIVVFYFIIIRIFSIICTHIIGHSLKIKFSPIF